MKTRNLIYLRLAATLLPVAMAGALSLGAAPQERAANPEMTQSVFSVPNNPSEGRDPFFPQSTRRRSVNSGSVATNNIPAPINTESLVLKSIVGGLAVINNHSFAPGEEGDVLTEDGRREHIQLVEIKAKTGSVVVKIGGQTVELTMQNGI